MDRTIETITCDTIASLPSIDQILAMPRDKSLRVIFSSSLQPLRERVGAEWKEKLPGFLVGIHITSPEIVVRKLITEQEIEAHAVFFEQCAGDYRKLATHLIYGLATRFKETIDTENAMHTFRKYKQGRQGGMMSGWKYFFHGAHCRFTNGQTG